MCSKCDKINVILKLMDGETLDDMLSMFRYAMAFTLRELGADAAIVQALPSDIGHLTEPNTDHTLH